MSRTGTDPNKILMGDLKPELAAKADMLSSKFAPKPRRAVETEEPAAQAPAKQAKEASIPVAKKKAKQEKKVEAAPFEEELTQMNIRIPVSLKRDIDRIVFEKKYAGEDVNIKSLVSQWIQERASEGTAQEWLVASRYASWLYGDAYQFVPARTTILNPALKGEATQLYLLWATIGEGSNKGILSDITNDETIPIFAWLSDDERFLTSAYQQDYEFIECVKEIVTFSNFPPGSQIELAIAKPQVTNDGPGMVARFSITV